VLGTVAVERIVDGLMISIVFFAAYLASDRSAYPRTLELAAWGSLLGFLGLTLFLAFALAWTEPTIRLVLAVTALRWLSPRLAEKVADKLRSLIRGFRVLRDPANLLLFLGQSVLYWGTNGLGMWILARAMGLPISITAAYATMSFTGVVISLPNAPGLVGQFHAGIKYGLLAYLPEAMVNSVGLAYAVVLHGLNFVWYVGVGFVALLAVPGGTSSLRTVVTASSHLAEEGPPLEAADLDARAGEPEAAGPGAAAAEARADGRSEAR
jgi:hypothetical protein